MTFVFLLFSLVLGGFVDVDSTLTFDAITGSRFSVFSVADAPFGTGQPFVQFNLTLQGNASEVHVMMFSEEFRPLLTESINGETLVCCSPLVQKEGISNCPLGHPILLAQAGRGQDPAKFRHWSVVVPPVPGVTRFARHVNLTAESGIYSLVVIHCDTFDLTPDAAPNPTSARVGGFILWKNPYGYLSGSLALYMSVYTFLACAYFILLAGWVVLCAYNWNRVTRLQLAVGGGFALLFLENMILTADWSIYNYETGIVSLGWNITTVIVFTVRAIYVWILTLLIAMGFGLFRRSVRKMVRNIIVVVAVVGFVLTAIYQSVALLSYTPQVSHLASPWAEWVFLVLVTVFDFLLAFWIGYELYSSQTILKAHKQLVKLQLFQRIAGALIIMIVVSVILFIVLFFITVFGEESTYWRQSWLFGTSWQLLQLCVMLVVFHLFYPRADNHAFEMTQLPDDAPHDTEMQSARDEVASRRAPAVEQEESEGVAVEDADQSNADDSTGDDSTDTESL